MGCQLLTVSALFIVQDIPQRPAPRPTVILIPVSPDELAHARTGRTVATEPPGFTLTSPENGVMFDVQGDGHPQRVPWTEPGAEVALLALDVDGDGRITSGKELFGTRMFASAKTGADALIDASRAAGAPDKGAIEGGDALYDRLLLWVDRNHNGISEPSELRRAKELFTAIGLGFRRINFRDAHGNRFSLQGWMEVRTAGPDQTRPTTPQDHFSRVRPMFEVELAVP